MWDTKTLPPTGPPRHEARSAAACMPSEHCTPVHVRANEPCYRVAGARHEPFVELDAAKVALDVHWLARTAGEHALGEWLQPG